MSRALWLTETYPPDRGGMAESCDRIVRGLRRGAPVDVVHLSRRHAWLRVAERAAGLEFAAPLGYDTAHDLNLLWAWLSTRPERAAWTHVVAFGGDVPVVAGPVIAAWLGLPLVLLLRGNDFDAAVWNARRRPALADAVACAACVCTVSSEMAARVRALWPRARVEWVPNGLDTGVWSAAELDRRRAAQWRARHAPDGRRVLGLIGHLKAKKGAVLFLEALRRSGRAPDVRLLVAGPVEPELEAWLEARGEEVSAVLESERDRLELLPLYLACDTVCIPSFYDGLPNACLEALALGVPVLCAAVGGLADVVADGETGFTFPPGDREGCRDAIERTVGAPADELRALGARGAALVADRFSADAETAAYTRILR